MSSSSTSQQQPTKFRRNAGIAATILVVAVVVVAIVLTTADVGHKNSSASTSTNSAQQAAQQPLVPLSPITTPPSQGPSLSPSLQPSDQPTVVATDQPTVVVPSDFPTASQFPSSIASEVPTLVPTVPPITAPTGMPSLRPIVIPSIAPSVTKSLLPSHSQQPTNLHVAADSVFRLKMFWEQGYFWQEETFERRWCLECTSCPELNFNDNSNFCTSVGQCEVGDQLWVTNCDGGGGTEFSVLPAGEYTQIHIANDTLSDSLCLEHIRNRYMVVTICNATDSAQLFLPFNNDTAFPITPLDYSTGDHDYCATQQHHPKSHEIVGLKNCTDAYKYDTGLWVTYELA
jgi:hypothetical protein